MSETLTDSTLVTADQAPARPTRLRISLGALVGVVAVAATLFALGSQLSKHGGDGETMALAVMPMPVLAAVVIGCWKRKSATHVLGVIALSAVLLTALVTPLAEGWLESEFVFHFWIMLCAAFTLALPLLIRRWVGEDSGPSQARWLGLASVAQGAGLNLLVIFAYGILLLIAMSFLR